MRLMIPADCSYLVLLRYRLVASPLLIPDNKRASTWLMPISLRERSSIAACPMF
ncbi:hypothetical protein MHIR_DE00200 [Candidatus Doolittlea endobia]|uniref:Uncharacterized protein n=1 Tax=Candidatus Doolittlea endobia TaxID=1778262 RepID=A0A143WRZ7_9ENTR|nr:hypothetical protein MHIR_DE00200 [Candidatus Doolittlea endobia]